MIRLLLVAVFLIIFFIVSLPVMLVEWIIQHFNMDLRNRSSLKFVQFGLKCISFLSGVKLEVNGKENIPNQACLFVANHISFFDIVVTYPLMISPTGYIAKKELEKVPFLSWIMRFVNCIFLDRKDPRNGLKAVLSAADMIKSGISVFLFPEGTRSKTGKMGEFKDGGFKIATKSKAPVVPVGITGTNDILENHFPFIKSGKVIVSFGKPIYTTDMDRAEQKLLPGKAYEQVKTELATLNADIDLIEANIAQTELRAPFDGVIGLRQVSVGTYASPTTIVAKLTKISPLKVEFSVPERYANDVKIGAGVNFGLEGKLETFHAKVYARESRMDQNTHTLTLRALYPNANGYVMPGRYADIRLSKNEIQDALAVPSEAIVPEMGKDKIFLYKSGKAQPVEIQTGIRTEAETQVLQGLQEGDTIIISGTLQLRTGLPVTLDNIY